MAEHKHQHEHGTMDTTEHERTFRGFLRACMWVVGVSIATLIFLALVNA
jgi:hypothetical protein